MGNRIIISRYFFRMNNKVELKFFSFCAEEA